jgi:hypothetical protein
MRRCCQWLGRDSAASGRRGVDFGRWLADWLTDRVGREVKRTSGIVAGVNQRQRGQRDHRGHGAWCHEVLILIMSARAEGRWRGPRAASKVSMITMRLPHEGRDDLGAQGVGRMRRAVVAVGAQCAVPQR